MGNGPIARTAGRVRAEIAAVSHALALAGTSRGVPLAMFAAGLAHATPGGWGSRVLSAAGVRVLRLRPRRLAGWEVAIDPADAGHTCVVDEFFFPPGACDFSLLPFEPDAVIDCGAHIGLFTLLARRRFAQAAITAFEPAERNVAWLRRNLEANAVADVEVIAAAVSVAAGRRAFSAAVPNHSESGRLVEASAPAAGAETVTVVDLPAFVRERAPASLLLKLDVEGEEERLVPALVPVLPSRCALFFETHNGTPGWERVSSVLSSAGFTVRLLRQRDVFRDGFAARSAS